MVKKEGAVPSKRVALRRLLSSRWFFPLTVMFLLLVLSGLQISGSSLETYNDVLGTPQGKSLIINQPQGIRSDEWLVLTQMTLAQKNDNFPRINHNLGQGQDMAMLTAVPYRDWSMVFKPENLPFFALPFGVAFAFKWWIIAVLLVLSCYYFVLALLKGNKKIAVLVSLLFAASPFFQWWYQFGTLACVYYPLIIATLTIHLLRSDSLKKRLLLATGIAYVSVAFGLILYPPFMIATIFGIAAVLIGVLLELRRTLSYREIGKRALFALGAFVVAVLVLLIFIKTNETAVQALNNTVYPGKRLVTGGGVDVGKVFSGFLDTQLQHANTAAGYGLNQSENAGFILIAPFLFIPSIYLLVKKYRAKKLIDWPLLLVNVALVAILLRLTTRILDPLFNLLLFNRIPSQRLIIGLGLINILQLILFIRAYKDNHTRLSRRLILGYSGLVLIAEVGLALWTHHGFPGYIGVPKALVLALPIPIAVCLLLWRKTMVALGVMLLLSVYSIYHIQPLYHGTGPLTDNAASVAIRNIGAHSNERWISEGLYFENFPQMNGVPSLSGVYDYPQTDLWKNLPPKDPKIYNRYAHVEFNIDRTGPDNAEAHLSLIQIDAISVTTPPCSPFLQQANVHYILTESPITSSCTTLVKQIPYPNQIFFIYHIK